jgi:hypothetical protein
MIGDDYPSAVLAAASGQPLSALQYAALILGSNASTVNSNQYQVDNTQGYWDTEMRDGSGMVAWKDPATNVLYFAHANYIGPQQTGTLGSLRLPAEAFSRLGISPDAADDWELVIIGVALIVVGLATIETGAGTAAIVMGTVAVLAGVTVALLGAYGAIFTPALVSSNCSANSVSCCNEFSQPGGVTTTCIQCDPGQTNCTANTSVTSTGDIGTLLESIGIGIAVIGIAAVGSYAAYKIVKGRGNAPRQPRPAGPSYGERAGAAVRSAGSYAGQQARGFYATLRGQKPSDAALPPVGAT